LPITQLLSKGRDAVQQNGLVCERSCQFRHYGLPGFNCLIKFIHPSRFLFFGWAAAAIRGVSAQKSGPRKVGIAARTLEAYTISAA